MKRFSVILLCFVMVCGVLFAQGTNEVKNSKVTLTVLDAFVPGEATTNAWKTRIKEFSSVHPEVVIDEETISNADLTVKVQTLAAADELPDIFCLKGQMAENFVKNGKVLPVNFILDDNGEWKASFKEGVFSNFTFDGNIYAIPYQVTNTCVFYNEAIFKEAGIESFPTTWSELIDVCKTLKAKGYTPIVLGNKEKWNAESVIMSTLGNRVSGNEWYESIRYKKGASFTDPEFVGALQALYDLAQAGAFNSDVNSIDGAQQRQLFMNGKAAMTIDGTWAVSEFDANCPEDVLKNIRIAALPMVEGGKGDPNAISGGSGWGLAVNANLPKEKMDIVKDFVQIVISKEFAAMQAASGTPTAQVPNAFELSDAQVIAKQFNEFQAGRAYVPVYDHQLSSGVIQVMQAGLQELLIGSTTPEKLAASIQAEYAR